MLKSLLLGFLLGAFAFPALAMTTTDKSPQQLKRYGAAVASKATSIQWQQLWKNIRTYGGFIHEGRQPRFTVPSSYLPDSVSATIAAPDDVTPKDNTQVLFRRDFSPQSIGLIDREPVKAICVLVDFRAMPDDDFAKDFGPVNGVRLLMAQPCK